MSSGNIKVAIKARPILKREKDSKLLAQWKIVDNSIRQIESTSEPFYFDHIFDQDVPNHVIFDTVAKPIVDAALKGFNGTIFAYGQTSSGKTYTMLGNEKDPGVMILTAKEIFKEVELAVDRQFLLRVGYIEIYNEKIFDLLHKSNQELKIHETTNGDVSVNCEEFIITSENQLMEYLQAGSKHRKIGETNMNERSSRSHAIFRIIIESREINEPADEGCVQISNLNLVDLAGSERADQTGATGSRLKEGAHINKSLLSLSCVINKLSENESVKFINYRDSKLTRILQASLGGNALTAIVCNINPTAIEETNSTLSFAMRAKAIKNKPQVNEVVSEAALMKRLEKEIARLESELQVERTKTSKIKIMQLERQIHENELKIVHSHAWGNTRDILRRRTWSACVNSGSALKESAEIDENVACSALPAFLNTKLKTPLITTREFPSPQLEEFKLTEEIPFEDLPVDSRNILKTPEAFKNRSESVHVTPSGDHKFRVRQVEQELEELMAFTNLENKLNVDHDIIPSLQHKLREAQSKITEYEKEKFELQLEWNDKEEILKQRCFDLENEIAEKNKTLENLKAEEKEYNSKLREAMQKIKDLEMALNERNSLEFEQEQHQRRAKMREKELLECLNEKDNEIKSLNNKLMSFSVEKLQRDSEQSRLQYKCEQYEYTLQELNKRINIMESDYNQLSVELVDAIQESDVLKKQNYDLQTEITKLKEKPNKILENISKEEINNLIENNGDLDEKYPSFCGDLQEPSRLIFSRGMKNMVTKDKESFCQPLSPKNITVNDITKSDNQFVVDEKIDIKQHISYLNSELNNYINKNSILKQTISQWEQEKQKWLNQKILVENLQEALKIKNQEIISLNAEIFNLRSKKNVSIEHLDSIEFNDNILKSMKESSLLSEDEKVLLKEKQILPTCGERDILEESAALREKIQSLKNNLDEKEHENANLNDKICILTQTKDELLYKLNNLEPLKVKNDILNTELAETRVQISRQFDIIKNLNEELSLLQGQINKKRLLSLAKQDPIDILLSSNTSMEISDHAKENEQLCLDIDMQACKEGRKFSVGSETLKDILSNLKQAQINFGADGFILCKSNLISEIRENSEVKVDVLSIDIKSNIDTSINKEVFTINFIITEVSESETNDTIFSTKTVDADKMSSNIFEENDLSKGHLKAIITSLNETLYIQIIGQLSDMFNKIKLLDEKVIKFEKHCNALKEVNSAHKLFSDQKLLARQTKILQHHVVDKLSEMAFIIEGFNKKVESMEKFRDKLKERFKECHLRAESLAQKANTKKEENNKLISEFNIVEKSNNQVESELFSGKADITEVKNAIELQENVNMALVEEKELLFSARTSLEIAVMSERKVKQDSKDKLDMIKTEYYLLKESNEELEKELKFLNDEKIATIKKIGDLNNYVEDLKTENHNLRCENDHLKSDCLSMRKRTEDFQTQLNILSEVKADLTNKINELNSSIEGLKAENNILISESNCLNFQIDKEKNYNKILREELHTLQDTGLELEKKILEYEKNSKCLTEDKSRLNEELTILFKKNESLLNELKDLKDFRNQLERNFDKCQKENFHLENVVKDSDILIKQLEEECKALKLSTATLADNIMKLEQERESLLLEKERLEKEITNSNLEEKVSALTYEITNLKSEKLLIINKLEKLQKEYSTIEKKCNEKENFSKVVQNENQVVHKKLEQCEVENEILRLKNDELSSQIRHLEKQNLEHLLKVNDMEEKTSKLQIKYSVCFEENQKLQHEKLNIKNCLDKEIVEKSFHIKQLEDKIETNLKLSKNEIETLKSDLNARTNEFLALKVQLDVTSSENRKYCNFLDNMKKSLESTQKQLQMECTERKKYQDEVEKLSQQLEKMTSEYNVCLVQLTDYNKSYLNDNVERDTQGDTKVNLLPNKNLLKQLHEMQKMHLFKTRQLQSRIELLDTKNFELLQTISKSQSISENKECARKNTDKEGIEAMDLEKKKGFKEDFDERDQHKILIENLLGENKQLKIKNEKLIVELDMARKLSQQDRKSRRQSTHDEKRQSLWDYSRDVGTMTQPTDKLCNCEELDLKVNELKKCLRIKDCQINTLFLELKSNPLKDENDVLKKMLSEAEMEEKKLRIEISKLRQKLLDKTNEKTECSVCLLNSKKSYSHGETQTEKQLFVGSLEEITKLQKKCEDLKKITRMRRERIEELESKIKNEKENEVDNKQSLSDKSTSTLQRQNYEKLFLSLNAEYDILKNKYEQCKFICRLRKEEIQKLEEKLKDSQK